MPITWDSGRRRYTITAPRDGDRVTAADLRAAGVPLPDSTRYSRQCEYAVSAGGSLFKVQEGVLCVEWLPAEGRWVTRFCGFLVGARYYLGEWRPRGVTPRAVLLPHDFGSRSPVERRRLLAAAGIKLA